MGTQPPIAVPPGIYLGSSLVPPAAARSYMLGGSGQFTAGAQTAGGARLYPVRIPYPVPFLTLGFSLQALGGAGSTIQPLIYDVDANGNPRNLVLAGSVLAADGATGVIAGGPAGIIPAGNFWAGGLALVGTPTVLNLGRFDEDARGPFVPSDNLGTLGSAPFAFQSGLAAAPAVWAGTYVAGAAPMLIVGL